VVRRVVGIVAGRAILHRLALPYRVVVSDRNRLVMRDAVAILRAGRRAPGTHARVGAWLQHIDRGAATGFVLASRRRQLLFMRAPAELGRLRAFGDETLDRPGVDESVDRLRLAALLRVALGDVNAFDASLLH